MKYLLFLGLFLFSCVIQAQKNDSQLISRQRPGLFWYFDGLRPTKSADNHKFDRLIFDLTYSDWLGDLKPFQNRWNSIGFNTNFMKDIKFKELRFFSLGMGVGYGFSTISSDQRFMDNKQIVEMINLEKSGVFDYATIHAHRFYVPFELRFYTKNWNRFKFVIGGSAGLLTGFNQTLIGRDGLKQEKSNLKSNVQVLNYGIHCRFGLRNIAFFGSYQINSLFRERGNPNIHPLQLGLSLSLF